jgi:hypothetical protein
MEERDQDDELVKMSEIASRAIEIARSERLRIAATTPMLADEWVKVAATLEVSARDQELRSPPPGANTPAAGAHAGAPAAGDLDDTKELPLSRLTPLEQI